MVEARKEREGKDSRLSQNAMIRQAAKELKGFCKTREVQGHIKAKWGVSVSAAQVWNQLGSEKSRVLSTINGTQKQNAKNLLSSVYGDLRTAQQLLKMVSIEGNEKL